MPGKFETDKAMTAKNNITMQTTQDHVLNLLHHRIKTPFLIIMTISEFKRVVNHNAHRPQYMEALAMMLNYTIAIEEKVMEKNTSL